MQQCEQGTVRSARPRKLLEQVSDRARLKHYSWHTEESYIGWIRRFILFHGKRHPNEMGAAEVRDFLTHLARDRQVGRVHSESGAQRDRLFVPRRVGARVR